MDAEGFAAHLLGMDACWIGEPVVSMDDVKGLCASHLTGDDGVVVNLLVEIAWISSGKLHRTEVVDMHIVKIGIDMVAQLVIVFGRHHVADAVLHIIVVHIAPNDRHAVHRYDAAGTRVLITEGMGKTEHRLYVSLGMKTLTDSIIGGGQTTKHMRRILPTKH